MPHVRAAVSAIAVLLSTFSAWADTCPTAPPQGYQFLSYAGTNCNSALGGNPCAIGQPVGISLSIPTYYPGTFESCDVVTWQFGDGTSATTAPGVSSALHSYASAGNYAVTTTITNSLGSQATYFPTTVPVAAGFVLLPSSSINVNEGAAASILVRRTTANGTASVNFATADQSAIAGHQYAATSGTITFADGEIQKTITVPTLDDHVYTSSTMVFRVELSSPTGGYILQSSSPAYVYITDTDPRPLLSFEFPSYTVAENAGSVVVRVTRSGDLSGTVSAAYFALGSYYYDPAAQTGIVTFFPNETVKSITIQIPNDDIYNGDRAMSIGLQSATNGGVFPGGSSYNYSVPFTITEDEPRPVVTVGDVSVVEGATGILTTANVNVTLSGKLSFDLNLQPVIQGGTAVTALTSYLSIPAGTTSASFPLQVRGNAKVEPNKTFPISFQLYYCCSAPPITFVPGKITILNDDAEVTPSRISVPVGETTSLVANFGAPPATPQTVTFTSSDAAIATVPSSVIITAAFETVPVTGKALGQATITATIPAAYGGGTFTTLVSVYEGAVVVLSPTTVSLPVGGTVTITASMAPASDISETALLTANGVGAINMPDRVVVDAGRTSTFTITGVRKGLVALNATLGINHNNAVSGIIVDVTAPSTTPSITQVSPANGPVAGGTNVTVNGANLRNDCTIRFGGAPATNVALVSASSMTATTPEHAAGAADVTLSCGSDAFTFANGFTYLSASATLSNVAPSFGTTAGSTLVRITGSNIASGCWPFFDGIAAPVANVNGPSEVIAATPPHPVAATVPLLLRCTGASDVMLANAFTYSSAADSAPVITGVDPLVGSAGKPVTITGARFRYTDAVTFDAVPATVLSTSPGTHVVRIPDVLLGKTSIIVTDLTGHSSTTGPIFTIVEPQPPQIAGVSPTSTRAGNEVVVDGSGFRPGYTFTIGDLPATAVSMTYSSAVLRVPDLGAGTYDINALNAAGKVAAIGPHLGVLAPGLAVIGVTPRCVKTNGGTTITINGTGFAANAIVTIDGTVAAATVTNANTISITLPQLPTGARRIVVTNPNGDTAALSNAFTVVSPFDPTGCSARPRSARH